MIVWQGTIDNTDQLTDEMLDGICDELEEVWQKWLEKHKLNEAPRT